MVVQNIVFPDEICTNPEIYFRSKEMSIGQNFAVLEEGGWMSTDTYMNIMDLKNLHTHTEIDKLILEIGFEGKGILDIMENKNGKDKVLATYLLSEEKKTYLKICIPYKKMDGGCYWKLYAERRSIFWSGKYIAEIQHTNLVKLALNICTFHREKQLQKNLDRLRKSEFFDKNSELYDALHVFVVDNGNSFTARESLSNISIYRNSNKCGGSGGFKRGLEEICDLNRKADYTHVIFMDDDVDFQIESFYRIFAFLSCLKKEITSSISIAGRMFRTDDRKIQFTSVEKWNKGNIIHIDGNLDMTIRENAVKCETMEGDYGGWWFCVYPIQFVRANRPLPFFLHCDDVEYGLRFPGKTIVLKGVQVWHETYEYRITPAIVYYDTRNALIVNVLYGNIKNSEQILGDWEQKLTGYHLQGEQQLKFACTLGMFHFLKGCRCLKQGGKIPWTDQKLIKYKTFLRVLNPLFHRYVRRKAKKGYKKVILDYLRWEGYYVSIS